MDGGSHRWRIAGLAAVYELKKAGFTVSVFETKDRVAGRIWTVNKGDSGMDPGTAVYLGTYKEAVPLIHEVGLGGQFVETPVFIGMPRQGTTHVLDLGKPLRSAIATGVAPLPEKLAT